MFSAGAGVFFAGAGAGGEKPGVCTALIHNLGQLFSSFWPCLFRYNKILWVYIGGQVMATPHNGIIKGNTVYNTILSLKLSYLHVLAHFIMWYTCISTVAHRCHGKNKNSTAKTKTPGQKQKLHGKNKNSTAKTKTPRQKQKLHGENKNSTAKTKTSTAKTKTSRQKQKRHGKNKNLTAKTKTSRQKQKRHGKNKNVTAKTKTSWQNAITSRRKQNIQYSCMVKVAKPQN